MRPATEMWETSFSSVLQHSTFESADPVSLPIAFSTNTPWVQATDTEAAPASLRAEAAATMVPPVEIMSSTMSTFFPVASNSAGAIFTSTPDRRTFSRWSDGTPSLSPTSFARPAAPMSGESTRSIPLSLK